MPKLPLRYVTFSPSQKSFAICLILLLLSAQSTVVIMRENTDEDTDDEMVGENDVKPLASGKW